MKAWIKVSIIAICIFIGIFLYLYNKKESSIDSLSVNQGMIAPIKNPIDTSSWTNYTNNQLGFSIKIPPEVPTLYRCHPDGRQTAETPLKVYEDNQNGAVYISQEYYYDANWSQTEQKFISNCDKITYSLEYLKSEENKYKSGLASHPFLGWKIIINNPQNDSEVDSFVRQNFGPTCSITSKNLQEDGNYQISITGRNLTENGVAIMDETCFTNFSYKILYSPDKQKMMSVILGQECTFGTDPSASPYQCYDDEMIKSFKFE